jgi:hypothetical protein
MKKSAAILALVLLGVAASALSLGANSCGSKSDTGEIATISSLEVKSYYALEVDLKPTSAAQANHTYTVRLYTVNAPNAWREGTIRWTQPDLNVQRANPVDFNLDEQEYAAYCHASESELRKVFTVKLFE